MCVYIYKEKEKLFNNFFIFLISRDKLTFGEIQLFLIKFIKIIICFAFYMFV